MVGSASHGLLRLGAAALLVFGAVAFVAPGWASERFPWTVGPFLAMTIGGWSLGTAGIAWLAARDVPPARVYPLLVYAWAFAVGELAVVVVFADRLRIELLSLPYLVGLVALALSGVATVAGWLDRRPDLRGERAAVAGRAPGWAGPSTILFVVFVAGLSAATLLSGPSGAAARGLFFPEPMGLFSIRAFSAFFLALALAAASLLWTNRSRTYDELGRAGLLLIFPITLAAVVNISLFDFVGRPGSLLYLAAYVVVGALLIARLFLRRGTPDGEADPVGEVSPS